MTHTDPGLGFLLADVAISCSALSKPLALSVHQFSDETQRCRVNKKGSAGGAKETETFDTHKQRFQIMTNIDKNHCNLPKPLLWPL